MSVTAPGASNIHRANSFHELRQVKVESDPRRINPVGDKDKEVILNRVIKELTAHATPQKNPQMHIVSGQMGAGKSTVINKLFSQLKGNCVIVDYDELKRYVPGYSEQAHKGYPGTVPGSKEVARYLEEGLKEYGFENRLNMVFQKSINSRDDEMFKLATSSRSHDFRVSLSILAVDKSLSTVGILSRYESGLKNINEGVDAGAGARRTPMEYHDDAYNSLVDRERYNRLVPELDEVVVSNRAGEVYYRSTGQPSVDKVVAAIEQGRADSKVDQVDVFDKLSSLVEFNVRFSNPELRGSKA